MSWLTDECHDNLKCLNLLRKLLSFTANLCAIEEMPILLGCCLRLSLDDIKQVHSCAVIATADTIHVNIGNCKNMASKKTKQ